jgi:hypothetical protein
METLAGTLAETLVETATPALRVKSRVLPKPKN